MITDEGFAPVRKDKELDMEFLDMWCFSHQLEIASVKASKMDKDIPEWAALHPMQRMAHVTITEKAAGGHNGE